MASVDSSSAGSAFITEVENQQKLLHRQPHMFVPYNSSFINNNNPSFINIDIKMLTLWINAEKIILK